MSEERKGTFVPDAEYIAQFKAGELEAFGKLYRRYLTPIYRYIRTRVSTDRDAEDLAEMVFLKAFEALETYEERGAPFSAFLYRIARNAVVDHYRSQEPLDPLEDLEWLGGSEEDTEKGIIDQESLHEIKKAMVRLPDHSRLVRLFSLLVRMRTLCAIQSYGCSTGCAPGEERTCG
jgi:RNA polymerase sigma-70 factor (ECF subfamily)